MGDSIRWVGPSIATRPATPDFPWDWLDKSRATVLVSLGTANTDVGARFLTECVTALRARTDRVQAVIADPGRTLGTPDGQDKDLLILPSVPQLPFSNRSTRSSVTPGTTRSARPSGTASPSSSPRSATTSPSWPPKSPAPVRESGSASAG